MGLGGVGFPQVLEASGGRSDATGAIVVQVAVRAHDRGPVRPASTPDSV